MSTHTFTLVFYFLFFFAVAVKFCIKKELFFNGVHIPTDDDDSGNLVD